MSLLLKKGLVSLLRLCLSYNLTIYQQIFETAMDSLVSVVVVNIFMVVNNADYVHSKC